MGEEALKIALVVKSLDPNKGGHEKYINRMLPGLIAKECQIWCFAESFGEDSLTDPRLEKIRITPLKVEAALRVLWFNYRAQRRIRSSRVDFDLVFTTGNVSFGDIYRAGGGVHATYVENCLGPIKRWLPQHLAATFLQRQLFKKNTPEILITNSEMVKNDIQHRYGVADEHIRVVRNGIDLERFNPTRAEEKKRTIRNEYGLKNDDFVCLFTAGGGGRKGLHELLRTFASIQSKRIKLLVVGRTDASKLRKILQQLGLVDRVFYAGYQPKIEHYYGAADCLVFPSKYDAAANVVCEALACGVAVITTATNGSAELIEDGVNGYVIPSAQDLDAMRACIENLAHCANFREIRNSAIKTGQKYSMGRHISQLEAVVEECLDRKQARLNP